MNHPQSPFPDKEPLFFVDIPRLRGAMVQKGYNKTTLAIALGISRPTLDKYLKHPPANALRRYAGHGAAFI